MFQTSQVIMRVSTIAATSATIVLLALVPGSQALPKWLKGLNRRQDYDAYDAPAYYPVYDNPPDYYGGYSYGGEGPQPTISSSSTEDVSTASSTTENSPVGFSSSSSISSGKSSHPSLYTIF
jgi:hypothetical protein